VLCFGSAHSKGVGGVFYGSADSKRVKSCRMKSAREDEGGTVPLYHPRVFFVRVANKGLMLEVVCKSGKCRT